MSPFISIDRKEKPTISDESAEVARVVEAFSESWNKHDMNAYTELFSPDAEFVNIVGFWWRRRAEIKAAHAFIHQTLFKNSRLSLRAVSGTRNRNCALPLDAGGSRYARRGTTARTLRHSAEPASPRVRQVAHH